MSYVKNHPVHHCRGWKTFSNIKNILEPNKDITLDWVIPCITAGILMILVKKAVNKLIRIEFLTKGIES